MSGLGLDPLDGGYGLHDANPATTMSFPGWTLTRSTSPTGTALSRVEVISDLLVTDTQAYSGNQFFVGMTNSDNPLDFTNHFTLTTQLTGLTPGLIYDISFYYAGGIEVATGTAPGSGWTVSTDYAGGSTTGQSYDPYLVTMKAPSTRGGWTGQATPWIEGHYQFEAQDFTHDLNFMGVVAGDPVMLFLDNVQITTVPEPASALLCGAGAVALLLRRSRR